MKVINWPEIGLYKQKFRVELNGLEAAILYSVLGPTSASEVNAALVKNGFPEMPKKTSTAETADYILYQDLGKLVKT